MSTLPPHPPSAPPSALPAALPAPTHTPLRGGTALRWGILAPGVIADAWTTTVHANTDQRVVAVASRDAERAGAFASRHGIPKAYGDYEHLVADPDVDVVYIAPPHTEHKRLALLAIAAGKHVLVEKPLATSEADAREIFDAATAANVFAMEAMWTRFLPQTTIIRRLLDDGVLGALRLAAADFGEVFGYDPTSRAFDPALGGGALLDIGIYSLWWTTFALGTPTTAVVRGSLAPTGVEEQATIVTQHAPAALGIATSSMMASTPNLASVTGELARIEVARPFWEPGSFRLTAGHDQLTFTDPSTLRGRDGLAYQATAVAAHIAAGLLQAPEHPHTRTLEVLRVIDAARRELGSA
ncbi:MAG TPA: Gfo/Idh/MocA family oxidoreductase [Pseudolysinimonas sp.]|nr:Gfo/Idh/MocA family oxidoreductase [Pseudolysinimonas sp.]